MPGKRPDVLGVDLNRSESSDCAHSRRGKEDRLLRAAWMIFARTALAARSLETVHLGAQYCGRALSLGDGGEWGDANERTSDEARRRRERFETADGGRNPGHGKGSRSRG
jgi:hypothetical protein